MKLHVLFFLLFFSGIAAGQSTDKFMKVLYRDSVNLYFVKPLDFKPEDTKAQLEADFTYNDYRYPSARDSTVVMNFTLQSKKPVRELESVYLGTQHFAIPGEAIELFYIEQQKGKWHSRFSLLLPYTQFRQMLEQGEEMPVVIEAGKKAHRFTGHKSWAKMSEACSSVLP